MKIVSFEEFVVLPEGTIFSYYEQTIFRGLFRKGRSLEGHDPGKFSDYFETNLLPDENMAGEVTVGQTSRWGEYDWDQQYAVYEPADIEVLRHRLG